VLTRISGYSEVRTKHKILPGECQSFKMKLIAKSDSGCWSIGIVRSSAEPGQAWSNSNMTDKAYYLNTAKSNLFNGPLLQYFQSEGTDGQYSVDSDFGRTGRSASVSCIV